MKKFTMNLSTKFLSKIAEFDRNDPIQQINSWGLASTYTSEKTINSIVKSLTSGEKIKEPVEVIVYKNKALLSKGCHRLASAKRVNLKKIPVFVLFLEKLGIYKKLESKLKEF